VWGLWRGLRPQRVALDLGRLGAAAQLVALGFDLAQLLAHRTKFGDEGG
jgi:hypothetical protein